MQLYDRFRRTMARRPNSPGARRWPSWRFPARKRWLWLGLVGTLLLLLALAYAVAFLIDEPLRRYVERQANSRLTGYTVQIRALDFHPIGFSIDLRGVTIVQNANPDPPVAYLPRLTGGVHWRALLHRRVVADFEFERPKIYVNLQHFRKEVADPVPLKERGWQRALEAVYFDLKINRFTVLDGDLTYVDPGPFKPLRVSRLNLQAENIRNVRSKERVYPSELHLDGVIFDAGKVWLDGFADFLAEPHPGVWTMFRLENVQMDYFKPITGRYNVAVENGVLSADGNFEYASTYKAARIDHAVLQGAHVEYVHTARTAATEQETARETLQTAKEISNHPEVYLLVNQLDIVGGTFGFVNKARTPEYRVFMADMRIRLTNFSNLRAQGVSVAQLSGKFMGSGDTRATASFRAETKGADLDLKLQIENTDAVGMNDLWRTFGNFDAVDGQFSLYSEMTVRNGAVHGYMKPLFRNLSVYAWHQDREKSVLRQAYEGLVGGAAKLFRNWTRREVATKVTISGSLDQPRFSVWEAASRLIQNAFFKAIRPGLESEPRRSAPEEKPSAENRRAHS